MRSRSNRAHIVTRSRSAATRRTVAAVAAIATSWLGIVAVAPSALADATVFTVNSTADPGTGGCDVAECTLREAINAANANTGGTDAIYFDIGVEGGPATISPTTDLPTITDPVNIDGSTQPGFTTSPIVYIDGTGDVTGNGIGLWLATGGSTIQHLGIGGFVNRQILIQSSAANVVLANFLGTDAAGTAITPGGNFATIELQSSPSTTITGNVIGGGQAGVFVQNSNQVVISGNNIGIGVGGADIGTNLQGILVTGSSRGTNIRYNNIGSSGGLGIDLGGSGPDANDAGDVETAPDADTGPNDHQNYPVIDTAIQTDTLTVDGSLVSVPLDTYHLDFFASTACDPSGYGEGEQYVGSADVVADESGHATFSQALPTPDVGYDYITATATRDADLPVGNETSEFSACVQRESGVTAPSAPTGVSAGAGDAQATISWNPPDSSGGAELVGYTVSSNPESSNSPMTVDASETTATMTGLNNGTTYTFTVTATNGADLTSPASDPSNEVQPQEGAPPPESTSDELGPGGGEVSTGNDASSDDPTNTSVQSPNAGIVTIGESALTGTPPPGVTYFGQQVDITAPDAAADDPMTFTFVYDCSVLPAGTSTCADPIVAGPDAAAEALLAPTTASVDVRDGFYSPATASVRQGGTVTWHFQGTRQHSVTDKVGLGPSGSRLFNSGNRSPGSTYSYAFIAAGRYAYRSFAPRDRASMAGVVSVPVEVSRDTAGPADPVTVTWATSRPSGFRFDVQYRYKAPTASTYSSWRGWRTNTVRTSHTFTGPGLRGAGSYQFRSHLENIGTGKVSGWSDPAPVTVSSTTGGSGQHLDDIAAFHENDAGVNEQLPDCTGAEGIVQPAGVACTWSETIRPDGDLEIVVYTTHNNRWRVGKVAPTGTA
jgi:CSLREA domain-containing protein